MGVLWSTTPLATTAWVLLIFIFIKLVVIGWFMFVQRRQNSDDDALPIIEDTVDALRLREIRDTRLRAWRSRERPPTFEDALKNSRPVSVITMEEPPPTYEESMKAKTRISSPPGNISSVFPCDCVSPVDQYDSTPSTI